MLKPGDQLLALPIKGEAFLLRRGQQHVLVDGGYNPAELTREIEKIAPRIDYIDVVVCTHADGDHAKGLAAFLDKWPRDNSLRRSVPGRNVGEFWLPGRWADVLPELASKPREFVDNLMKELDNFEEEYPDISQFREGDAIELAASIDTRIMEERVGKVLGEEPVPQRGEEDDEFWDDFFDEDFVETGIRDGGREPDWFLSIKNALKENSAVAEKAFSSARSRILHRKRKKKVQEAVARYWLDAVETAKNIRNIAEQAVRYGVPIRWFDYEEYSQSRRPQGGVRNFLIPLNAVEQAPEPRTDLGYLARLSAVNQECLTFLAPPTISRLGVVFCGDSPMGDGVNYGSSFLAGIKRPKFPVVVTAPHHGSESNSVAYSHLAGWPIVCWLRTGGTKKHPGVTFKNHAFPRVCTHCPQLGLQRQVAAVVQASECSWRPFYGVVCIAGHHCRCA